MADLSYLNFDLQFERLDDGYRVTASGPDGHAAGVFQLPVSSTELENLVLRVGRTRRMMRRIDPPEIEAAKQFGRRLYEAVFAGPVGESFRRSLELAGHHDAGLRLRIRLTRTPELAGYPWEYLYDQSLNRFLSLSVATPIVRFLDIPERIRPLAVDLPLRVLAIISSPRSQPPLDVEREWANVQAALGELVGRGSVVLERLERATFADLQRRLRRTHYHILHFVGHGSFDRELQDGVLMLEDASGDGYRVSGQELGMLLHDHRSLRLVTLNACEGGRSAADDPFAGVAQSLVLQGIPAVIAMQFEVSDEAAIAVAHEFYGAVADGYPVDAALAEARKSVFAQGYRLEWGTPVLHLRAPDGRIFETLSPPTRERPSPPMPAEPAPRARPEPAPPEPAPPESTKAAPASAGAPPLRRQVAGPSRRAPAPSVAAPAAGARLPSRAALVAVPAMIALNIAGGELAQAIGLPIYMDSIGTMVAAVLFGPAVGLICGLLAHLLWTLIGLDTSAAYFAPVLAVVGLLTGYAAKAGAFRSEPPRLLSAAAWAVVAACLAFMLIMAANGVLGYLDGFSRWPLHLLDVPSNAAIVVAAAAAGAAAGFFIIKGGGYAAAAGLLAGAVAPALSSPLVIAVFNHGDWFYGPQLQHVYSQIALSDMADKMLSAVAAWALVRLAARSGLLPPRANQAPGGR